MDFITDKSVFLYLFFVVYFGFQIFSQMYGKYLSDGIPNSRSYLQNFVNALVLIALILYFSNPNIPLTKSTAIVVFATFILMFFYSFAKKSLDEQTEKEKKIGANNGKKGIMIFIIFVYAFALIIFSFLHLSVVDKQSRWMFLIIGLLVIAPLYFMFYFFRNREQTRLNFPLSLFIYPFLFLTGGVGQYWITTNIYVFLFTTVVALWGFFGLEWFTGLKKEYEGTINRGMCKAYLGLGDDDTADQQVQNQTQVNKKNINMIYVAVSLIFVVFVLALLVGFVAINKSAGY